MISAPQLQHQIITELLLDVPRRSVLSHLMGQIRILHLSDQPGSSNAALSLPAYSVAAPEAPAMSTGIRFQHFLSTHSYSFDGVFCQTDVVDAEGRVASRSAGDFWPNTDVSQAVAQRAFLISKHRELSSLLTVRTEGSAHHVSSLSDLRSAAELAFSYITLTEAGVPEVYAAAAIHAHANAGSDRQRTVHIGRTLLLSALCAGAAPAPSDALAPSVLSLLHSSQISQTQPPTFLIDREMVALRAEVRDFWLSGPPDAPQHSPLLTALALARAERVSDAAVVHLRSGDLVYTAEARPEGPSGALVVWQTSAEGLTLNAPTFPAKALSRDRLSRRSP